MFKLDLEKAEVVKVRVRKLKAEIMKSRIRGVTRLSFLLQIS